MNNIVSQGTTFNYCFLKYAMPFLYSHPSSTRTRKCENINIILQGTTKGALLKLEPVRVAHERVLDVLDNGSIRLIYTREAHRLRAMPGTVAPPLPNKSTGTTCAEKSSLVQSCWKTFRLIENLLLTTLPRTRRSRTGAQQKPRESTIKAGLEPLFGSRVFDCAIGLRWKSRLIENLLLPIPHCTRRMRTGDQLKPRATTIKADPAGLRLYTWTWWMSLVRSRRTDQPGVHQYATWSTQLLMPTQPAPSECW